MAHLARCSPAQQAASSSGRTHCLQPTHLQRQQTAAAPTALLRGGQGVSDASPCSTSHLWPAHSLHALGTAASTLQRHARRRSSPSCAAAKRAGGAKGGRGSKRGDASPPPGEVIDVESSVIDAGKGGGTALATRQAGSLAPRREGYHVVPLDTCEFLFAAGPDGALDMSDVYVYDKDTDVYARPETSGEMPTSPSLYQVVQWKEEYLGDALNYKPPVTWVKRAYLIRVACDGPGPVNYRLDLDCLLEVCDQSRKLSRCEVDRPPGVARSDREVLRIRNGRFTVVPDEAVPTPDEVIEAALEGGDAPNRLPGEQQQQQQGGGMRQQQQQQGGSSDEDEGEIGDIDGELADDDLDNLDVPAIDLA